MASFLIVFCFVFTAILFCLLFTKHLKQFLFSSSSKIAIVIICAIGICGCQQKQLPDFTNRNINDVIIKMTDIMVHDITNPPLATRFFSYTCLAGYEVVAQNNREFESMHGKLNDYPLVQTPGVSSPYSYQLAALLAMMETAKKMHPSGKLMDEYETKFLDSCKNAGIDKETINNSLQYAQTISKQILAYAKADNYNKISNLPRYTPLNKEGSWFPTPPGYFEAVEPHFNTVRPFILDSCNQFKPEPPVEFSTIKGSPFFKLIEANYKAGNELTEEQQGIAAFWDCNPFAMQDNGHLMYGIKKISPGAHWLGIAGVACAKEKVGFDKSMQIFTVLSVGLMDGFICCWDEKFRSNRIRPETAIRKYIDPTWQPLLQTPPFPEYLSGHSVISAASATILTHFFGNQFSFTDDVEVQYGLPPRTFSSFNSAAEEAAISRFYGGIHFMDAIDNGLIQGREVGERVLQRLLQ